MIRKRLKKKEGERNKKIRSSLKCFRKLAGTLTLALAS